MARGRSRSQGDYGYDDEYDYDQYEDERYRRSRARPRTQRHQSPRRKRRTWPILLLGCLGGVVLVVATVAVFIFVAINRTAGTLPLPAGGSSNIPGIGGSSPSTFTKTDVQQLPVNGKIAQVQVHNQIGNITLNTDPAAQEVSVTTFKTVKAANQNAAQSDFSNMQAQASIDSTNTLTVSASVPSGSGSLLGSHNDTIDLTIVLPASSLNNGNSPMPVDIETSVGNVQISGLNGVMTVKDDIGNVTVQQAQLFDGSHLETGTGDVSFNGALDTTLNSQANYKIQCEVGNLNVTLPATTNVVLDANTNVGNIKSAFPINAQSSDGSGNYYGPLLPNASPAPTVTLVLDVSSGNIGIEKG